MENVNAKLGALEGKLTCRMPELDLRSSGVQCSLMAMSSADAAVAHGLSQVCSRGFSFDGVLEAARHGDLAHLRAILYTCPPEEVNLTTAGEGMSALHLAARAGHTEAVRILLGSKKFEAITSHASKQGDRHTALHSAAAAGHEGVVKLLLSSPRFSAISATASRGFTALHLAAWHGHAGVAGFLLDSHRLGDADVNAVDNFGSTALHAAADSGNTDAVMALLHCARFHKASAPNRRYNATALHGAAGGGHTAMMIALLESPKFHTAAVNASHAAGYTALHVAVKQGHYQAALTLRDSSRFTAVTARCMEGRTAIDIARQRGDEEMISLLLSWPGAPFV